MAGCWGITDAGLRHLERLTVLDIRTCSQITYSGVAHLDHLTQFTTAQGDSFDAHVPLFCAISFNNAAGVGRWVTLDPDLNTTCGYQFPRSLLLAAARLRSVSAQTLQLLIDAGADVNGVCIVDQLARDLDTARMLLDAGAWVDAVTTEGETALSHHCTSFRARLFLSNTSNPSYPHEPARTVALLQLLLAAGASFQ